MSATLRELAERFGCVLHGPGDGRVDRVATLAGAGPDALTFLANPHYRPQLRSTRAGAVVLEEQYLGECPVPALVCANPYAAYARMAAWLHPPPAPTPGVHASAVVAPDAVVDPAAEVAAQAVVGPGSTIGASAVVGPGCVVGANVSIGAGTRLAARVTLLDGVEIGRRCIVHPGVVVGADGFGFAEDAGMRVKVPQLGTVIVGDDVEIGANTAIDRGAIENTVIEDGVKIDNLVQIGHNVRIGAHSVICGTSAIAGSAKIGRRCVLAGGVGVIGHIEICDDAVFLVRSLVTHSVSTPGVYSGSLPAEEASRWRRNASRFKHLDEYAARLRALERRMGSEPTPGPGEGGRPPSSRK
ncbi:MAG TPA: UDP-3-O-(3-hydroxymyristoyl)glucosamine N-acyltransferase [Gammaproteobacteria bacterium]|nr:UDP-3-O-(3-hydroxymyristoyl)glucosamine N-acyltransferase [Gammaproteobacteria bacterium]